VDGPKYIRALYNGINSADDGFESAVNFFTDFPNDNSGNPFYWPYSIVE